MNTEQLSIGEYTGTWEDVLDRHEKPDYIPPHYPSFSDKKWKSIYHLHRRAIRLLEIEELSRYSEQLVEGRKRLISILEGVHTMKAKRHIQWQEEKTRTKTISQLKSGNRPKSVQQILTTDYSDLGDNFMIWLWITTLFANKNAHTKGIRSSTKKVLDHLKPILQERGLPLEGDELKNYYNNIPSEELREYGKAATGHTI